MHSLSSTVGVYLQENTRYLLGSLLPAVSGAGGGSRKAFPADKDPAGAVWPHTQNEGKDGFVGELVAAEGPSTQGTSPAGHLWARGGLGLLLSLARLPVRSCHWVNLRTTHVSVSSEDINLTALDAESRMRVLTVSSVLTHG